MWKIRRILALCLCLVLLAGTACAEEIHKLGGGYWGYLNHGCTLPDGRLVLVGTKSVGEANPVTEAWVLCLNPDLTVSWEDLETGKNGFLIAEKAAVLPDGTIAVVFNDFVGAEYIIDVKTYTQDGLLTGKGFDIPAGFTPMEATPEWLMLNHWDDTQKTGETLLMDWNGKELLRYSGAGIPDGLGWPAGNTDELVLAGHDRFTNGCGKIVKLDLQTGEVLWETTLDRQKPDAADSSLGTVIKTEDGGYLGLLQEKWQEPEVPPYIYDCYLVKFDAEGKVQWINGESFERDNLVAFHVFSYDGKIGTVCVPKENAGRDGFNPLFFRWFDADGKELGTTEVKLNLDDFPIVRKNLELIRPEWNPGFSVRTVIPAADGLWALIQCYAGMRNSKEGVYETITYSYETVLVRIPELSK